MDLDKAIKSRRSVKKFKDKKPDWRDIVECIDSMRYAPMAGNHFSLKFILVYDKEKIKKIAEASQQQFIAQTDYVLIIFSVPSRTTNSFGKRGEIYLRQQAGAAIQNFLLKIRGKKLATCWIGHFIEETIKKEFNIPENSNVEAIFPIGYEYKKENPKQSNNPKRKIELDTILYFNKNKNKKMQNPNSMDI